ncbi:MAG: hypothetical protein D9V45_12900 [Chloroflexi bacterium]|nr:MAG: hypothetical protein D9V45_12900 [Chloroflexota bacterium]
MTTNDGYKGNQNAVKHGGAGAVKALTTGAEFTGLPAVRESEVRNELAEQGRAAVVLTRTVRLQTAADLYFDAFIGSLQAGDLENANGLIKVYAWLQSSALRAWVQVAADEKDAAKGGSVSVATVLESIRKAKNETNK